jgi:hypothetical protein
VDEMGSGQGIVQGQDSSDDSGEIGGVEETLQALHLHTSASTCHIPSFTTTVIDEWHAELPWECSPQSQLSQDKEGYFRHRKETVNICRQQG